MERFTGERQSKTLTFTQEDTAIGQASSHHGDQMEALGIGPEVLKNRMEGKWIERRSNPREEGKRRRRCGGMKRKRKQKQ